MVEALPLIVNKEEEFVLDDRATKSAAKHIPAKTRTGESRIIWIDLVFPTVGVQYVVPEKFPDVAVKTVRTRLEGCADDSALKIAEFRGGV